MSLSRSEPRSWWLAISLCLLPSCGGELIRLGDQAAADRAGGGNGGTIINGGASGAVSSGDASGIGGEKGGSGGNGGSRNVCPHAQVAGPEVLWIGDSWIQLPGTQHSRVEELAHQANALDQQESYFNLAAAAASMAAIAKQYESRQRGATKVKVLLMDGGTWDPIAAQMSGGQAAIPAAIDNAVSAFQEFVGKVASDGTVEHIVYFLVPELPTIPGVATIRPRVQQVCAASSVPCHFIDLQPYWQGHPEYTAPDGIQSSEAGAVVIADLIWQTMQVNCIAQ